MATISEEQVSRSLKDTVLESPLVYRLWQASCARAKLEPVFQHNDLSTVRRALDLGCGPGTNTSHFAHCDYLGLDINPAYVAHARRRHARQFIAADVRTFTVQSEERFDFILLNSFLHHIDDMNATTILESAKRLLSADGHVHVLDLVLPADPSASRTLALRDRGDFPRPLERWREIFSSVFVPVVFEPYPIGSFGLKLWQMVYFKGKTTT